MPMLKISVRYNSSVTFYSYLKNDKKNWFLHGNEAGHGNLQRKKLLTVDML